MSRNDRLVRMYLQKTGTLDGATAGTVTPGNSLLLDVVEKGTLSARCVVDAETNGLTITAKWQISNDGSTWEDVLLPNSAAYVVLATGTSGSDAAVTANISAPDAVYGARYARIVIVNGAQTGTSSDTYDVSYSFARDDLV